MPVKKGTKLNMKAKILKSQESIILDLRRVYEARGYRKYKMNKFEEYDLYLENKSFLKSDRIITFNDLNGKLLALKPDVTLSIVKNTPDEEQKLYYTENVYRVRSGQYKEIMQVGLEYIGCVDTYTMCEVLTLAAESLGAISGDYILDISHLGFISGLTEELDDSLRSEIVRLTGAKDVHEIKSLCDKNGINPSLCEKLCTLAELGGSIQSVLPECRSLIINETTKEAYESLEKICEALSGSECADKMHIDFSVINDMDYYSGITFRGFINGIAQSVLSGGSYDKLLEKFGKKKNAVGFAVYMDALEYYCNAPSGFDVDVFLKYKEDSDPAALTKAVNMLLASGQTVFVSRSLPKGLKYRQLLRFNERGLEFVEGND